MWLSDLIALQLALLVLIFLLAQADVGAVQVWRQIRPMIVLLALLAIYTSLMQTPAEALEMTLRLLSLMLSGVLVTLTTPLAAMMEVLERLLKPLEKLGLLKADRVALAFGLTLRLIPELSLQWNEIREAQAARGLRTSVLTLGVPMLMRTLRRAEEIAEAIDARSLK
jgi:biotin transport system permease protein